MATTTLDQIIGNTKRGSVTPEGIKPATVQTTVATQPQQLPKPTSPATSTATETQSQMTSTLSMAESPRKMSYVEMYQQLNPYKPPTAEQIEAQKKKQKREAMFAAIGDGISALSNLFFTTRYAPNSFDPSKGMTAKARERFDRIRLERDANKRQYLEGYMRAAAMDEARDKDDRNWMHMIEREKVTDRIREAQDARADAQAALDRELAQRKISAAEHKAEYERIKAQYAADIEELKKKEALSRIGRNNAAAGKSRKEAGMVGKKYFGSLPDKNGNNVDYYSEADYEAALNEAWRGIEPTRDETSVSTREQKTGERVKSTVTTTTTKPKAKTRGERAGEAKSNDSKDEFSQYEIKDDDYSQYKK